MTLQGKVALVTGGGRGVGAATAKLLAARGARVGVNYLSNEHAAKAVVAEIIAASGQAQAIQADVRDARQVAQLVAEVVEAYGRIDILVSNAAMHSVLVPFEQITWEEFSQRVNDELCAAFNVTKAVLPMMERQQCGRLIYIASEHARGPALPGSIGHGTAKAALVTFAKYLAYELGPRGITANVVSPAMVETERNAAFLPESVKQRVAASTPLGRVARPEDVARVIAFFADDDSGFMTGTYAPVTGGLGLSRRGIIPSMEGRSHREGITEADMKAER
ncbi:MAG: SDR family oxidoreductase [Ktedonobacteraceae bacterium]|nr:SDR family oxidoreductase [Ktedonobacteraceae bacterium]